MSFFSLLIRVFWDMFCSETAPKCSNKQNKKTDHQNFFWRSHKRFRVQSPLGARPTLNFWNCLTRIILNLKRTIIVLDLYFGSHLMWVKKIKSIIPLPRLALKIEIQSLFLLNISKYFECSFIYIVLVK